MKIYANNKVIQKLIEVIEVELEDIFCRDLGIDVLKDAIKNMLPSPIPLAKKKKGRAAAEEPEEVDLPRGKGQNGCMRYFTRGLTMSLVELIYRVQEAYANEWQANCETGFQRADIQIVQ